MDGIKSMGLYRNVDRILADLEASGHKTDGALRVDNLTPFDQLHYEGTGAVDDAIVILCAGPDSHILDIGSGIGGPARYLADRTGANVTALEIQQDLHTVGASLTARCGLAGRVAHLYGDVTAGCVQPGAFTGLMSMLCFLHIPDRSLLFAQCARALQPGGVMFVDDFYARAPLSAADSATLRDQVFCPYLPDRDRYVADVAAAGFEDVKVTDKTEAWRAFVVGRLDAFRAKRAEVVGRYGTETVDQLDAFYAAVAGLFVAGRLGGLRLTARRPASIS